MVIAEYGRNLHQMIYDCCQIEDRAKRTRTAEFIVNVMAQMNPKVKESVDYRQKLWDHLHIMADFKLDVDSPYPPPSKEVLFAKPKQVRIHQGNIRYRHYGRNIENIINKAIDFEEGLEKEALVRTIANHLKKSYITWNRNTVDDEVILKNLSELSKDQLKLDEEFKLSHTQEIINRNKKKKIFKSGNTTYSGSNGNNGGSFHKTRKKGG